MASGDVVNTIGGSQFVGSIEWLKTTSLVWSTASSSSFNDFISNAIGDDNPRTIAGKAVDSSLGLIPQVGFPKLKKGHYVAKLIGAFGSNTYVNNGKYYRLSINGAIFSNDGGIYASNTGGDSYGQVPNMIFSFDLDADLINPVITVQGRTNTANPAYILANESNFKIELYYYPTAQ